LCTRFAHWLPAMRKNPMEAHRSSDFGRSPPHSTQRPMRTQAPAAGPRSPTVSYSAIDGRPLAAGAGSFAITNPSPPRRHVSFRENSGSGHQPLGAECMGGGAAFFDEVRAMFSGGRRPKAGVCYYPEDPVSPVHTQDDPAWSYANGQQHAPYQELQGYKYHGEGALDSDPPPRKNRFRRCWYYVASCFCLCLMLPIVFSVCASLGMVDNFHFWPPWGWHWNIFHPVTYDCDAGLGRWEIGWSVHKKTWCCEHHHRGCVGPHPHDHGVSFRAMGSGIINVLPEIHITRTYTSTSYTTTLEPLHNCSKHWHPHSAEAAWCCLHIGTWCPQTTTGIPWDCWAGYSNWERGWSEHKKEWCCEHQRVACPPDAPTPDPDSTTLPLPPNGVEEYNCAGGDDNAYVGWSVNMRAWCCEYKGNGCPSTITTTTRTSTTITSTTTTTWIDAVCETHTNQRCGPSFRSVCQPGRCCSLANVCHPKGDHPCREPAWSDNFGDVCTRPEILPMPIVLPGVFPPVVLPAPPPPPPEQPVPLPNLPGAIAVPFGGGAAVAPAGAALDAGLYEACDINCVYLGVSSTCNNRVNWLMDNRHMDCTSSLRNVKDECPVCRACQENIQCAHYDCNAGFDNWKVGWSHDKKAWCCAREDKGCDLFDCDAGFDNWLKGWAPAKKSWCCSKFNKGCHYDCDAGYDNWKVGWSLGKKQWCCTHKGKGCDHDDYDCDEGWTDWRNAWDPFKKSWCCTNVGRGCAPQPGQAALR